MIDAVVSWWVSLMHHGLVGPLIAVTLLAFVVLLAGNAVVWTLVGVKSVGRMFVDGFRRGWAPKQPVD